MMQRVHTTSAADGPAILEALGSDAPACTIIPPQLIISYSTSSHTARGPNLPATEAIRLCRSCWSRPSASSCMTLLRRRQVADHYKTLLRQLLEVRHWRADIQLLL
jgi:hypothetical protein